MEAFSGAVSASMRTIVGACEIPVILLLLAGVVFIVCCLGSLISEYFSEHKHFRVFLPKLVDELKAHPDEPAEVIKRSGLLMRQKRYLIELTKHPQITDAMRESMAVGLEHQERRRYEGVVKVTDMASRIAPMLGLLGTLIPLGPGIVAMGTGNIAELSSSLLTAFDTTALGLMTAAVALIISAVRKRWYKDYMVAFDAIMECVLEIEKGHDERWEAEQADAPAAKVGKTDAGPFGAYGVSMTARMPGSSTWGEARR